MNALTDTAIDIKTLVKYLSDMAAAEEHLLDMVKIQDNETVLAKFPNAHQLLTKIRHTAESHLSTLENLLRQHNAQVRSTLKEVVTAVTGTALGVASMLRTHSVSKILRDVYTTLSLNAIGYSMLHTTGLALRAPETAALALAFLKDVASLIIEVNQAVIPVVVTELSETEIIDPTISQTASTNILNTWRSA